MVAVDSDSIDEENEGKLIAISGKLDYDQVNLILFRTVEMYEWVKASETKDDQAIIFI